MPRPQFTLRALLVAMLVVAAFFLGIRFERQRQRREREAELAREAESAAVSAQGWRRLLAPSTAGRYKMGDELLFDDEHREKLIQELAEQEKKIDRLMLRFNALMAEERQTEEASALDGAP